MLNLNSKRILAKALNTIREGKTVASPNHPSCHHWAIRVIIADFFSYPIDTECCFRHATDMRKNFVLYCIIVLCSFVMTGCTTTTTRTRIDKTKPERSGVEVEVHENGILKLYGNPIKRKSLIKRLVKEESADKGRAVVLQAKGDVRRAQLEELRDFLVANRIPNVVIVTQLNAFSYEEKPPYRTDAGN